MKRRRPGHDADVRGRRGRPVRRPRRPEDARPAGHRAELGRVGRGKLWLVVTSQEKLNELVSGLDDKRVELARLMDRFPLQVHLEPSRHLRGHQPPRAGQERRCRERCSASCSTQNRGRLADHTHLTADIALPELTRQTFVDLYPLLPYQVDLIIQVVSGLRTQGGASQARRRRQPHDHQAGPAAPDPPRCRSRRPAVGTLVRLDHVYDLVDGNINTDIRAKIVTIPRDTQPPARAGRGQGHLPASVRADRPSYGREHRRGALPEVGADCQLPAVKAALGGARACP